MSTILFVVFLFFTISVADAAIVEVSITAGGGAYSPSTVNIVEGDTVQWTNNDTQTRNVSSNVHPVHSQYSPLNLGNVAQGGTLSLVFNTAGTYGYHDHIFASNLGTVVVSAPSDTTAPADVTGLAASNPTTSSIDLAWTAPGDDGSTGTATSYDIRYSTATITDGNWSSATQASGEPTPQVAGSSESMTISGLSAGTTYYFAIKTSDEVPNESGLSNVVSSNTITPTTPTPAAEVSLVDTAGSVIVDGDLITIATSFDIYIVKLIPATASGQAAKKFKRLILNPAIFNSYGHLDWGSIKTVSQEVQDAYTLAELVIEVNADGSVFDPKVYKVSSVLDSDVGQRQWINLTAEEFVAQGYDWDAVYHINHTEAGPDFYPESTSITA